MRALRRSGLEWDFHPPLDALALDHASCAGLMKLWRRIHWSCGDGMMPPRQLWAVYRYAATWPVRGDIVELGAWVGLTTSYLATACMVRREGCVHAVDTFAGTKEGETHYPSIRRFGGSTQAAFRDQITRAGVTNYVKEVVGLTTEAALGYRGAPIRLLLIDADHSYAGVRADFEAWIPHVAPGGLIIFHDYALPSVARFVDEIRGAACDIVPAPGFMEENIFAVTKRAAVQRGRIGAPVTMKHEMAAAS